MLLLYRWCRTENAQLASRKFEFYFYKEKDYFFFPGLCVFSTVKMKETHTLKTNPSYITKNGGKGKTEK